MLEATEMKAIVASEPGGPEKLQITTRPIPTPADDEILINVKAAGVNRPDCIQRAGNYPPLPEHQTYSVWKSLAKS